MILCVMPNPAIDATVVLGRGEPDRHEAAGGKGANVARAIVAMGGSACVAGPIGGPTGTRLVALAHEEGLTCRWTMLPDILTRTCTMTVDAGGLRFAHNEPGPAIGSTGWARFLEDVADAARGASTVAICGSLPPMSPATAIPALVAAAGGRDVWVDTSGAPLRVAIDETRAAIKINRAEAQSVIGEDSTAALLAHLAGDRDRVVVITDGAEGATIVHDGQVATVRAPTVDAVNATGSGDCFLGALLVALEAQATFDDALRLAVAAGTVNATTTYVHIDAQEVRRLADRLTVEWRLL